RSVRAGAIGLGASPAAALTFDRALSLGRRIEVDGGGSRLRIVPRRRRPAGKAARRRRGAGPGGRGRRRAFDGCVRTSHGAILAWGDEQNKNIMAAQRPARGQLDWGSAGAAIGAAPFPRAEPGHTY